MSDHHSHDLKKDIRRYVTVFIALLIGTLITVLISRPTIAHALHIPIGAMTIVVALFIASIKAFLVAGYFMHLISEKKMIYGILASTGFFLISLMFLIIWAMHDFPAGTVVT